MLSAARICLKFRVPCTIESLISTTPVRPGTAGLLTDMEYSRIRDSTWYVSYPIVTTRIGVELVE